MYIEIQFFSIFLWRPIENMVDFVILVVHQIEVNYGNTTVLITKLNLNA